MWWIVCYVFENDSSPRVLYLLEVTKVSAVYSFPYVDKDSTPSSNTFPSFQNDVCGTFPHGVQEYADSDYQSVDKEVTYAVNMLCF